MSLTVLEAKQVVIEYLGKRAADNFEKFFEGESKEEIEKSLTEILVELLGTEEADKKMKQLKSK